MNEPTIPQEGSLSLDEKNQLKILALWEKIRWQKDFKTQDGTFNDHDGPALGRIDFADQNLQVIIEQRGEWKTRTITIAKFSNGAPLTSCTLPSDRDDDGKLSMWWRINDPSKFYDGVLTLLIDPQIGESETIRLQETDATKILKVLT